MKRLNPQTNEPFKRGDIREDGKVFYNYTTRIKADGYFTERWLSPSSITKVKSYDRDRKNTAYKRIGSRLPKNLNQKLNNDPFAISIFKSAWRYKYNTPDWTEQDIIEMMEGCEQYLYLILPGHKRD